MGCPKCKGTDTMTKTTTTKTVKTIAGLFWRAVEQTEETTTSSRCLDCGHEWEGEDA